MGRENIVLIYCSYNIWCLKMTTTALDGVLPDPLDRKCKLRTLNEMITCKICHGYLVDATTVTECLHTFCKSCIVKHLEDSTVCPECEDVIHQSHPLDYIIVPGLEKDEYDRERKFYRERGLPCPKDQA